METFTTTHWGSYRVEVEQGRLVGVRPVAWDRHPSPIGQSLPDTVHGPSRVRRPAVRAGFLEKGAASRERRGSEPFVEVSWDEATTLVANEIERVRRERGNEAIFGGSYGWSSAGRFHHAQSQVHRFLNAAGGYVYFKDTYSNAAGRRVLPYAIAELDQLRPTQTSWSLLAEHCELFVAFGGLPTRNSQVNPGGANDHADSLPARQAARARRRVRQRLAGQGRPRRGARSRVALDPAGQRHRLHPRALPRADRGGLVRPRLRRDAHERVRPLRRVRARHPRRPAQEPGLGRADRRLQRRDRSAAWRGGWRASGRWSTWPGRCSARSRASSRSSPWSCSPPCWARSAPRAAASASATPASTTSAPAATASPARACRRATNPVEAYIPVARLSDMLLNPGAAYDYNGAALTYPEIRLVYWAGGNAFHHHQDINRLIGAWRRPETIVVHEAYWTAQAKFADIVLPATDDARARRHRQLLGRRLHDRDEARARAATARRATTTRSSPRSPRTPRRRASVHRGPRRDGVAAPSLSRVAARARPRRA